MPDFGEILSDSDSDVAAIEVKDHYSDEELDNPLYDEQSDEESSADSSPPRKRQKIQKQSAPAGNSDSVFITSLSGNATQRTEPSPKKKPKKKKNRMGQNARRR